MEGQFPLYTQYIKKRGLIDHVYKLHNKMNKFKDKDITLYDKRADYKQVLAIRDYDPDEYKKIIKEEFKNTSQIVLENEDPIQ